VAVGVGVRVAVGFGLGFHVPCVRLPPAANDGSTPTVAVSPSTTAPARAARARTRRADAFGWLARLFSVRVIDPPAGGTSSELDVVTAEVGSIR
jgi:hypothetical protein